MKIEFDATELRPLIEAVVREMLTQPSSSLAGDGSQMAFSEPQAASMLGVKPHVLRDLRLKGEIEASVVGRRIVYQKEHLLRFLNRSRWGPS